MDNRSYHEQKNIEYIKEIRSVLAELPVFVTTYFRGIEPRTQARTRLAYAQDLRIFFEWLVNANPIYKGKTPREVTLETLGSLEVFDIEEFMEYLKLYEGKRGETVNSEQAVKRKMCALRGLYGYLYRNEMISSNPSAKIDMPKLHDKAIIRFDEDEIGRFLDIVEKGSENMTDRQRKAHESEKCRDLAILTLMLGTGIRVSECVGLDLKDVDLSNSRIKVTRKGGSESFVYFGEEVCDALIPYLDEREDITDIVEGNEDALFLSSQKKRLCVRSVENLVKKYASGVTTIKHITPHKLRSTYGTALYRETGDIYLVADVLGHKDVNTTRKHYAAIDEDRRMSARNAVRLRDKGDQQ